MARYIPDIAAENCLSGSGSTRNLPVKIALYNLTTTTRWGGVETFVWEVAAQMAERGHEVHIFGGRGAIEGRSVPGVRVRRFPYIDRDLWRKLPLLGTQYTLTKL